MKLPEYAFQFQLQFAMVAVVEHHDLAPKTIKNLTIKMSNLVKTKTKTKNFKNWFRYSEI